MTAHRRGRGVGAARVLFVLLAAAAAALTPGGGAASANADRGVASLGAWSAQVILREPIRYAVILREPDRVRLIRTRGDSVLGRDQMKFVKIERVGRGSLLYRAEPGGPLLRLRTGMAIPELPGFVFADTVLLEQLSYRYRAVERITNPDPVLVSLDGSAAILEVETLPQAAVPPAGTPTNGAPPAREVSGPLVDEALLSRVRVQALGREQYELHRGEVRVILDNAGQVLGHLRPLVLPVLTMQTGLQFRIRCAASDGVLGKRGFTVTSPKVAGRVGIEAGDVIVSVNGRPVDGFGSLYQIYQDLKRDPAVARIDLELEREGKRLVKTYWLR